MKPRSVLLALTSFGIASSIWTFLSSPILQAAQADEVTGVVGDVVAFTGRRVPELLLMLCAFGMLCFVVWTFVRYLEKRDERNTNSQMQTIDKMQTMASDQQVVIRDNTQALRDGEKVMGKVLSMLGVVERKIESLDRR